ncbi:MAG: VanW family protein [Syntrophomonas sp.]|nr:VanW family protein [Syntrophomonas sp.]
MDRIERDLLGVPEGVTVENVKVERLLPGELRGVVEEMAMRYQKLPIEPRLDQETGAIIAEESGTSVDVDKTLAQIQVAAPGQKVQLEIITSQPRHRSQDITNAKHPIAGYQTWFHGSPERYKNISVALKSINNTLVWPGEVFSFNEVTGPRTPERGYLPAPIILNGGFDVGYGGGVCQVSSTVYNAALLAKLPIIERHAHTKPVHYVPEGKDATVNYGYLDMKFSNNRNGPLIIKTTLQNGRIYVELRTIKE